MSEYQYYEFQALDRPLTQHEMHELRKYSTRATITANGEIYAVAGELLGEVNVAEVAASVKDELESLDVDDIFDKSGARRDGYVDPGEAAFQMFEEALAPFLMDVERYRTLGRPEDASVYCLGILKGIYGFDKDSSSRTPKSLSQTSAKSARQQFVILHAGTKALFLYVISITRVD